MKVSEIKELSNENLVELYDETMFIYFKNCQGSRGTKGIAKECDNLKTEILERLNK